MSTATRANEQMYGDYYDKPAWWFRWRYDTQIKRKVVLALARRFRRDWNHAHLFELGFGSGAALLSFPRTCRLYGVEISDTARTHLDTAARRLGFAPPETVAAPSTDTLPFPTASMDLVIASHVLEHVPDDAACLRELGRLLKPGGALIVLVPINERYPDPNHARHYTRDTCRHAVESAGFSLVHAEENEWIFYLVERLYWSHAAGQRWGRCASAARMAFNFATARLPLGLCRLLDRLVAAGSGLPPRQAALLFTKP